MIKAVFFDIDGTLLDNFYKIPQSTINSLNKLKEKGIKIVISTGRGIKETRSLGFLDIGFDSYITLNGQLCYDRDLNLFFKNPINEKDSAILIDYFRKGDFSLSIYTENGIYINHQDKNTKNAFKKINCPFFNENQYKDEKIYLATAFGKRELRETFESILKGCIVTYWGDYGMDIISESGGKSIGIKEFLKKENINIEETMAIGDSDNDIDMLKFVNVGVAMGNGNDDIKKIADYITSDINDNGIEKALQHFGLID